MFTQCLPLWNNYSEIRHKNFAINQDVRFFQIISDSLKIFSISSYRIKQNKVKIIIEWAIINVIRILYLIIVNINTQ